MTWLVSLTYRVKAAIGKKKKPTQSVKEGLSKRERTLLSGGFHNLTVPRKAPGKFRKNTEVWTPTCKILNL